MKFLKMLGVAAIAAAAMTAFAGATTASATVLCKVTSTPCGAANHYPAGTSVKGQLKPGTTAELQSIWTTIECNKAELAGKSSNTGSSTETVTGLIEVLAFEECSCAGGPVHITVLEKGSVEIHHITGTDNATVTAKNSKVTVKCTALGSSCIFGTSATGTDMGEITGGTEPAEMHPKTTLTWISGDAGAFICGSTSTWSGEFELIEPLTAVYAEPS